MTNVLIVYATDYGNTRKMAEAIATGAKSVPGTQVSIKLAEETTTDDLIASDAVIVGTPVHMGSPDWRVKKFIDTVCSRLWMKDSMVGKVGAIFATGSGYGNAGGGCELTMLALLNNLVELGMVIVPLPKNTPGYHLAGLQWGPYGRSAGEKMEQTGVTEERLEAARHHGANVSRIASVVKGHDLFAKPTPVLA
ncbi:MAG: flavodoxin domain-containing protein [Scytonema sp. PMC 1069.18]|nr:flavodoxin domain-containing protein [Scytonema sp. PMC 1069.18]MEC4879968.1 flavodoxin domain-containing protein [Scytonema sp. PMC 1070.18]